MPRLALFCTNFLPYSQAFVYEQLRLYERYEADVFAWRRFYPERFPYPRLHVAEPSYIVTRRSRRFSRVFEQAPFQIVHAHFGPGGTYALPFAQKAGLPLVVTFHGYDVPLLTRWRRFLPLHLPYALRGPGLLSQMALGICASTELYDMLRSYGVPASRLRVHRLGVDVDQFRPGTKDPEQITVVMIGRFVEKKGFEYGLQAFARAARHDDRARLVLVGSGERESALRRLVSEHGIGERVTFAGVLSQGEVAQLLARADVLLAPSVVARDGNRESGLIVVKEAAACEAVPIGTLHGGIPDSIDDGESGFLVPERDVEAMAARLEQLLADASLRRRMGSRAREKMLAQFDNKKLVAQLETIYDEVSGCGAPSASSAP